MTFYVNVLELAELILWIIIVGVICIRIGKSQ